VKRLSLLFVVAYSCAHCAVITDLSSFLAQTGPNSIATFDDVPAGTASPFTSGGATFSDAEGAGVLNTLVGLGHSFWFGSAGSPPNFYGTLIDYSVSLPRDENAFGFLMACFGCDPVPNDSRFSWTLRSATGVVVGSGSAIVDLSPASEGAPRFLGVTSPVSFRSIEITKRQVDNPGGGLAYVIDDFRFAQAIPEPSSLVLIGSAFAALSAIRSRPRRGQR
jgi:hypothetical protein